uniref:Uncharacterized protein n=1 Tax=Romanomermis culicivorax TaxID=13658 RepID=A0A915IDY1_ROMCU
GLSKQECESLNKWIQEKLGVSKVNEIKITYKLDSHPCLISVPEMSSARFFLQSQAGHLGLTDDQKFLILKPTLEINPK